SPNASPHETQFDPVEFLLRHRENILPMKDEPLLLWALGRGERELMDAILATEKVDFVYSAKLTQWGLLAFSLKISEEYSHSLEISMHKLPTPMPLTRIDIECGRHRVAKTPSQLYPTVLPWLGKRGYKVFIRHLLWQFT